MGRNSVVSWLDGARTIGGRRYNYYNQFDDLISSQDFLCRRLTDWSDHATLWQL